MCGLSSSSYTRKDQSNHLVPNHRQLQLMESRWSKGVFSFAEQTPTTPQEKKERRTQQSPHLLFTPSPSPNMGGIFFQRPAGARLFFCVRSGAGAGRADAGRQRLEPRDLGGARGGGQGRRRRVFPRRAARLGAFWWLVSRSRATPPPKKKGWVVGRVGAGGCLKE